MPQTQIACPQCRQMIAANIEQLVDVTQDPQAKQRMLGGQSNTARCPHCGFQGRLATPIVYHDNAKELLLTFFPPEMNVPLNEQERTLGPLIKKVTDSLPPEKRKGYLLNPTANLSYESMVKLILEKDGVTPEMLKEQQDRVQIIERLLQASSNETRSEIIKQNETVFDEQFFTLFSRLAQSAAGSGQGQQIAQGLVDLQNQLLEETAYGRQLKETVEEMEAAQKSLQEAGKGLTREKLLDIVLESATDTRLKAYVSLARGGMDYEFFQLLTDKIDKASGDDKTKLEGIREKLLEFTSEIDKQIEARYKQSQEIVENILSQDDVVKAIQENAQNITQDVVDIANQMLKQASEKNDYARMGKLQKMIEVLRQASTPPEVEFIEHLLDAPDDATLEQMLEANKDMVNDQLMEAMIGLVAQVDQAAEQGNPEAQALSEKLSKVYKTAMKFSMKKNMEG